MTRRLAAIVLAAGGSRRMGPDRNKLLEEVGGRPLVTRPVDALLSVGVHPVVCVTGYEAGALRRVMGSRPVELVCNPDWAEGMGGSIAVGAQSLDPDDLEGVLVCLGDLPGLRPELIEPLVRRFEQVGRSAICVPIHAGRRGHPVLFGIDHLPALQALRGDRGARDLIAEQSAAVIELEIGDPAIYEDVDTPEALARLRERANRSPPH